MMTDAEFKLVESALRNGTVLGVPGSSRRSHTMFGHRCGETPSKLGTVINCDIHVVTDCKTRYGVAVCMECENVWVVWSEPEPEAWLRETGD